MAVLPINYLELESSIVPTLPLEELLPRSVVEPAELPLAGDDGVSTSIKTSVSVWVGTVPGIRRFRKPFLFFRSKPG